MSATKRHRTSGIRFLLGACLLFVFPSLLPAQVTLHVLIFADTDDRSIGDSVRLDAYNVERSFKAHVAGRQLVVQSYVGDRLSQQGMLDAIGRCSVRPNVDGLVVYFAGHGAWDPNRGHYVKARNGYVYRSTLIDTMDKTGARLRVLVTDCCSNIRQAQAFFQSEPARVPHVTSTAFVGLFMQSSGLVDISGSSRGEVAMGDSALGGFFTRHLWMKLDEHADGQVSWDFLVTQVRTATAEEFRDAFPVGFTFRDSQGRQATQRTQTVTARLDLGGNDTQPPPPPPPPPPQGQGLRFGVVAQQVGNQLRINRVFDDSPAKRVTISGTNTRAALEVGDVIVAINGRAIRTEQEFLNAVAGSGRNMSLEIICRRNSTRYSLDVYLAH